jgi:hypothetical protein
LDSRAGFEGGGLADLILAGCKGMIAEGKGSMGAEGLLEEQPMTSPSVGFCLVERWLSSLRRWVAAWYEN